MIWRGAVLGRRAQGPGRYAVQLGHQELGGWLSGDPSLSSQCEDVRQDPWPVSSERHRPKRQAESDGEDAQHCPLTHGQTDTYIDTKVKKQNARAAVTVHSMSPGSSQTLSRNNMSRDMYVYPWSSCWSCVPSEFLLRLAGVWPCATVPFDSWLPVLSWVSYWLGWP